MASLLEKAKSVKIVSKQWAPEFMDYDHVELAMAWAKDEITTAQAAEAMGVDYTNAPHRLHSAIRWAIRTGMLYANLKPPANRKK